MVDSVSSATRRNIGLGQTRPAPSVSEHKVGTFAHLAPDQRVEALQAAVGKLIARMLPGNSRLKIERNRQTGAFIYRSIDCETGEVLKEWAAEELIELREHLKEIEGLLLDREV